MTQGGTTRTGGNGRADPHDVVSAVARTVWPLLVVSSEGQRETLAEYLAMARADASRNGWCMERIDDFREVASGKHGVRTPVVRLLNALTSTPADMRPGWVWMRRTDRIGRGLAAESTLVLHKLRALGVRIWDHDRGEVRLETAQDEIVEMLMSGLGRLENEVKRGKAIATYERRRVAGLPVSNRRPYGLKRGTDGRDIPDEPHAEVIRTLFRLRADGLGYGRLCDALLAMTVPFRYQNGREVTIRWTPTRIVKALRQPAYVGVLIDEVTVQRARQVDERAPKTRGGSGRYSFPLAGALRCSCGMALTSTTYGRSPKRIRYYRCQARWSHGGKPPAFRADRTEAQFRELLGRIAARPALAEVYRRSGVETSPALLARARTQARAQLADLTRQRQRIWELHEAETIRDDTLQERLDALESRRQQAEALLRSLAAQEVALDAREQADRDAVKLIEEGLVLFARGTPEQQRAIASVIAQTLGRTVAGQALVVEEDGSLTIRSVTDPGRQARPRKAATI